MKQVALTPEQVERNCNLAYRDFCQCELFDEAKCEQAKAKLVFWNHVFFNMEETALVDEDKLFEPIPLPPNEVIRDGYGEAFGRYVYGRKRRKEIERFFNAWAELAYQAKLRYYGGAWPEGKP